MAQRTPAGLKAAGRSLWKRILGDLDDGWELDQRELVLLERACRVADQLHALGAVIDADGMTVPGSKGQTVVHPAVSEARQLELVQLRLWSALQLADPVTARAASPRGQRAAKAADARWSRRARVESQLAAVRDRGTPAA